MNREELIARAKRIHDDGGCSCDPKYIMSCPNMAAAVLQADKPPAVSAPSPGQAAYEKHGRGDWEQLADWQQDVWEAIAANPNHTAEVLDLRQKVTASAVRIGKGLAEIERVRAERNQLRDLAAAADHFAETWSELITNLPDSYQCTFNCPEANAAAELSRALGAEKTAAVILAAHAAHDVKGDEHYQPDRPGLVDVPDRGAAENAL